MPPVFAIKGKLCRTSKGGRPWPGCAYKKSHLGKPDDKLVERSWILFLETSKADILDCWKHMYALLIMRKNQIPINMNAMYIGHAKARPAPPLSKPDQDV